MYFFTSTGMIFSPQRLHKAFRRSQGRVPRESREYRTGGETEETESRNQDSQEDRRAGQESDQGGLI
jgi:hypothetical protein